MSVEILSTAAQMYETAFIRCKTFLKVTQGHRNCRYIRQAKYNVLLVICGNNVSVLHRFRDIANFTVYVTARDLEKSFSFNKTVEITRHVRYFIHV